MAMGLSALFEDFCPRQRSYARVRDSDNLGIKVVKENVGCRSSCQVGKLNWTPVESLDQWLEHGGLLLVMHTGASMLQDLAPSHTVLGPTVWESHGAAEEDDVVGAPRIPGGTLVNDALRELQRGKTGVLNNEGLDVSRSATLDARRRRGDHSREPNGGLHSGIGVADSTNLCAEYPNTSTDVVNGTREKNAQSAVRSRKPVEFESASLVMSWAFMDATSLMGTPGATSIQAEECKLGVDFKMDR